MVAPFMLRRIMQKERNRGEFKKGIKKNQINDWFKMACDFGFIKARSTSQEERLGTLITSPNIVTHHRARLESKSFPGHNENHRNASRRFGAPNLLKSWYFSNNISNCFTRCYGLSFPSSAKWLNMHFN